MVVERKDVPPGVAWRYCQKENSDSTQHICILELRTRCTHCTFQQTGETVSGDLRCRTGQLWPTQTSKTGYTRHQIHYLLVRICDAHMHSTHPGSPDIYLSTYSPPSGWAQVKFRPNENPTQGPFSFPFISVIGLFMYLYYRKTIKF